MKKKLKTLFFYSFLTVVLGLLVAIPSSAQQNLVDLSSKANDFFFEISQGKVKNTDYVNKFGETTNADNGVLTDIWDGANTVDDDDIWNKPTVSQTHWINSTSANDAVGGTGAHTITIYGLTNWNSTEKSETITLNGITANTTTNSYVIINRMRVDTSGNTSINEGYIKAVGTTDRTTTAQINPNNGQTEMAVYGIPRGETAYLKSFYSSIIRRSAGQGAIYVNVELRVNTKPENNNDNYRLIHDIGLSSDGTSNYQHLYQLLPRIDGPAIIKMQVESSNDNSEVTGGFDLILTP